MRPTGGDGDLERRLEHELARTARRLRGPSPSPSQSAYHRFAQVRGRRSLLSVAANVSTRAAASLVAVCLLGAGGAVAATAATGSPNPVDWGHTVTRAVTGGASGEGPVGHTSSVAPSPAATTTREPGARSTGTPATPAPQTGASAHSNNGSANRGSKSVRSHGANGQPSQGPGNPGVGQPSGTAPTTNGGGNGGGSGGPSASPTASPAPSPFSRPSTSPRPSPSPSPRPTTSPSRSGGKLWFGP